MVTCSFEGFMTRLGILVVGVFFGFNTLILGMMADSGTTLAVTFGAIAMLGSASLVIGGIVGAFTKRWIALVPGTVLILTSLTPALPPLAIVSVVLIYCCFFKPRNIENNKDYTTEGDDVPVVQLHEHKNESLTCDVKKFLV